MIRKLTVFIFLLVGWMLVSYGEVLDFSHLKTGDVNVYQLLLRGVVTNKSSWQNLRQEFKTEMYLTQVVREVSEDGIIIQTSVDKEKSYVNGQEAENINEGAYYFTQIDKFGNLISQAVEGGKLQINSPAWQIAFPEKDVKVGDTWEKILDFPGTSYRVRVKYRLTGWENKNGKNCAVIESNAYVLGDSKDFKLSSKGKIYFDYEHSLVEESVVTSYLYAVTTINVGGIEGKNNFSLFLTATLKHLE